MSREELKFNHKVKINGEYYHAYKHNETEIALKPVIMTEVGDIVQMDCKLYKITHWQIRSHSEVGTILQVKEIITYNSLVDTEVANSDVLEAINQISENMQYQAQGEILFNYICKAENDRKTRQEENKKNKAKSKEELCKILSEYFGSYVEFIENNQEFYSYPAHSESGFFITETYNKKDFSFGCYLPPDLIIEIGKFYKELHNGGSKC